MLITSHFAATTAILVGAEYFGLNVDAKIIAASYVLGVGIDLDHIVFHWKDSIERVKEYKNDRKNFQLGKTDLHSFIQEPIAVIVALLITIGVFAFSGKLAIFVPFLCYFVHVAMDSLIDFPNYIFWPFSKKAYKGPLKQNITAEALIGSVLSILLFIIFLKQQSWA